MAFNFLYFIMLFLNLSILVILYFSYEMRIYSYYIMSYFSTVSICIVLSVSFVEFMIRIHLTMTLLVLVRTEPNIIFSIL